MSKFDEICQAYGQARQNFQNYQLVCRDFARELVFGMIDYFEWPQEQEITYIPLGEELEPSNRFYALAGAMRMDDESFWHFGVELTLHEQGRSYPVSFVMSFFIKKMDQNFIVKMGPKGREIRIPESQRENLDRFYDLIFLQFKQFFERDYFKVMTRQEKELGFITLL